MIELSRYIIGKNKPKLSSSAKYKMKPAEKLNVPHKASQTNTNTEFTNHLTELPSLTEAGSGRGAALGIINSEYIQAKEAVRMGTLTPWSAVRARVTSQESVLRMLHSWQKKELLKSELHEFFPGFVRSGGLRDHQFIVI